MPQKDGFRRPIVKIDFVLPGLFFSFLGLALQFGGIAEKMEEESCGEYLPRV